MKLSKLPVTDMSRVCISTSYSDTTFYHKMFDTPIGIRQATVTCSWCASKNKSDEATCVRCGGPLGEVTS